MTKTKPFDCVEMKRQGQERLHKQLKGMSMEQQIEWWQKRNEEFMRKQDHLRAQRAPAPRP
jgi:hypothetical protein